MLVWSTTSLAPCIGRGLSLHAVATKMRSENCFMTEPRALLEKYCKIELTQEAGEQPVRWQHQQGSVHRVNKVQIISSRRGFCSRSCIELMPKRYAGYDQAGASARSLRNGGGNKRLNTCNVYIYIYAYNTTRAVYSRLKPNSLPERRKWSLVKSSSPPNRVLFRICLNFARRALLEPNIVLWGEDKISTWALCEFEPPPPLQ